MGLPVCINKTCRYWSVGEPDYCDHPYYGEISQCKNAVVGEKNPQETNWYLKQRNSNECQCGETKKPGNAFCYNCFMSLPIEIRKRLNGKDPDRFAHSYEQATNFLTKGESEYGN